MRALRVNEWGRPLRMEEVPDPIPEPGECVIALEAAAVGHLDRTIWSGGFLRPPELPYTPGVDGAGRVISGGSQPPGTRVWVRGGGLGVARDGTWAERVAAPETAVGLLPDGVPMSVGAAFFSPCTSAWVALHDVAAVRPGERVLVTGGRGAVGSISLQIALDAGATVSTLVAGALADPPRGVTVLTELTDAVDPFDVVVDTVGGPVLEACLTRVASGGRVVTVGYLAGHDVRIDLPQFVQRNAALLPLNMIARETEGRAAAPDLLHRLASGRLELATTAFGFDEIDRALTWLGQRGRRGRAVVSIP